MVVFVSLLVVATVVAVVSHAMGSRDSRVPRHTDVPASKGTHHQIVVFAPMAGLPAEVSAALDKPPAPDETVIASRGESDLSTWVFFATAVPETGWTIHVKTGDVVKAGHVLCSPVVHKVMGLPAWVFWGMAVPWAVCTAVTVWAAFYWFGDLELHEDSVAGAGKDGHDAHSPPEVPNPDVAAFAVSPGNGNKT